jgi:hypothetical protein
MLQVASVIMMKMIANIEEVVLEVTVLDWKRNHLKAVNVLIS